MRLTLLVDSLEAMRDTERVVGPDASGDEDVKLPLLDCVINGRYGHEVLLVIPTDNKAKITLLKQAFETRRPEGIELRIKIVRAHSEVGEQPYNHNGKVGAYNRIRNALKIPDLAAIAETSTVIVTAIENYIRIHDDGPIDYGIIVIHNATNCKTIASISNGVTVPQVYFDYTQQLGYNDDTKLQGKIAVGTVMADCVEGLDKADWHKVVSGSSRYDLLAQTLDNMQIPWS